MSESGYASQKSKRPAPEKTPKGPNPSYLTRGLSSKTLLICDLWETGMTHVEIADTLKTAMSHVYSAIYRGRQAGLNLRPIPLKNIGKRGLSARYNRRFGSVADAVKNLPEPVMAWLMQSTPEGATVADFMASFVLDAYNEEVAQ